MTEPLVHFDWRGQSPHGDVLVATRQHLRPGHTVPWHDHGYGEAFWIEAGAGLQRTVAGESPLAAGDLVFLRPEHRHALAAGPRGLAFVNVVLPWPAVRALERAWGGRAWPWRPARAPLHLHVAPARMERLHAWADELADPGLDARDRACFILDCARLAAHGGGDPLAAGLPPWLAQACAVFSDPRHLAGGAPQLARLAGRSLAHCGRTVRSAQGRTATELVNALRLRWAAGELRMGALPAATIAERCGFRNLSHFYRLFHAAYGTTPARYRQSAWQVAGG